MRIKRLTSFFWFALILCPPAVGICKSIILEAGETYQDEDLQVMCVQRRQAQPIIMKECQYWDEFNKQCLYEQKNHLYRDLECIEKCQHWDSFNKRCDYETKCVFHPSQGIFVQTTCEEFDAFSHVCARTGEHIVDKPNSAPP